MEIRVLTITGLFLIAVAWFIQFAHLRKRKNQVSKTFVAVDLLGVVLLIIDGCLNGAYDVAFLNALILAGALLAFSAIKK